MSASALNVPLQNRENTVDPSRQNTRQVLARDDQYTLGFGYVFLDFSEHFYRLLTWLSSWWLASELCPLLAGTLGPLATSFTVCSLSGGWASIVIKDKNGRHVQNQTNRSW
jgi:hypothetical protein